MIERLLTYLYNTSFEALKAPFELFISPEKRLHYIPLLSALAFSWIVICLKTKKLSVTRLFFILFSKRLWLHPSSILDMKLIFVNSLIKSFLITPWILGSFTLTVFIIKSLRTHIGEIDPIMTNYSIILLIFTLVSFIFSDFLRFIQHFIFHKVNFLWQFHQIHHSAEVLTPLSLHRAHPIEIFFSTIRNVISVAIPSSLFIYLFKTHISGYDILGVNSIGFMFNLMASNLRHSQIWLRFGKFEHIFISPAQHQMHHSKNYDYCHSNYGVCLSLWDKLIGTLKISRESRTFKFGLPDKVRNHSNKLSSVYFSPIIQLIKK